MCWNSGAAYGVSAFVKGQGVPILKQLDIVTRLKESIANGSINNRQVRALIYISVCMYVCMYCMYVCMYSELLLSGVCMNVCMYVCMCNFSIYEKEYFLTISCFFVYIVYLCVFMYVCMYVCMCLGSSICYRVLVGKIG